VLPAQSLLLHSCNLIWRDAERDHQDQQHGRALRYLRIGTALSIAAASPTGPAAPLSTNTRRHFATLFSLMDDPKNVGHSLFFPSLRQHMITVVQLLR
jgi:hypothetical protein